MKNSNIEKMLNLFADYYSVLPVCVYVALIYISLITRDINHFKLAFYIFLSNILVSIIKSIKFPSKYDHIFKRPKGASNCNYLSSNGCRENYPGFPSGHMTTTAFFCYYQILNGKDKLLHSFIIVIMGWARHYKKCHTVIQIITGTILGSFLGRFYSYIE